MALPRGPVQPVIWQLTQLVGDFVPLEDLDWNDQWVLHQITVGRNKKKGNIRISSCCNHVNRNDNLKRKVEQKTTERHRQFIDFGEPPRSRYLCTQCYILGKRRMSYSWKATFWLHSRKLSGLTWRLCRDKRSPCRRRWPRQTTGNACEKQLGVSPSCDSCRQTKAVAWVPSTDVGALVSPPTHLRVL